MYSFSKKTSIFFFLLIVFISYRFQHLFISATSCARNKLAPSSYVFLVVSAIGCYNDLCYILNNNMFRMFFFLSFEYCMSHDVGLKVLEGYFIHCPFIQCFCVFLRRPKNKFKQDLMCLHRSCLRSEIGKCSPFLHTTVYIGYQTLCGLRNKKIHV